MKILKWKLKEVSKICGKGKMNFNNNFCQSFATLCQSGGLFQFSHECWVLHQINLKISNMSILLMINISLARVLVVASWNNARAAPPYLSASFMLPSHTGDVFKRFRIFYADTAERIPQTLCVLSPALPFRIPHSRFHYAGKMLLSHGDFEIVDSKSQRHR